MNQLIKQDLQFVVSRIPKDIRDLMQKYPIMLGGGFVRSTISGDKVNDFDIFSPDDLTLKLASQELAILRNSKMHETKYAVTLIKPPRIPAQFIKMWMFSNMEALIDSFDYTICQAAVRWQPRSEASESIEPQGEWVSCCGDRFYADLAARRLFYTSPSRDEAAGGSMLRMRKFVSRGYTIQAASMAAVIARLVLGIDFRRLESFSRAKGKDRETAIATVITSLLREVDPMVVIDGIDFLDEHEIITLEEMP